MTASATSHSPERTHVITRLASALRREYVLFLLATGAVGLHIVDDNFVQRGSVLVRRQPRVRKEREA